MVDDLASHSTRSDVGARCSVLERSPTLPAAVTRAPASSSAAVIVVVVGSIEDGDKGTAVAVTVAGLSE